MKIKTMLNYQLKIYLVILIGVSIIINALLLFINGDIGTLLVFFRNLIPILMFSIFISELSKLFSNKRFYLHIIPVSNRKITIDMILSFIISYILIFITKAISVVLILGKNITLSFEDIQIVLLKLILSESTLLLTFIFILTFYLIYKIYLRKALTLGIFILIFWMPRFSQKAIYYYTSNIDLDMLGNSSNLLSEEVLSQTIYYNYQIEYAVVLLGILIFNLIKVNKIEIS